MWKYHHEGFFCLTYVEPKHQSDEHNQAGANDFQRLIWIRMSVLGMLGAKDLTFHARFIWHLGCRWGIELRGKSI